MISCRGYTAPEYAIKGELSEKADIYSFGVLVLEIISCRKNTDLTLNSDMQYLPEYVNLFTFSETLIILIVHQLCDKIISKINNILLSVRHGNSSRGHK